MKLRDIPVGTSPETRFSAALNGLNLKDLHCDAATVVR
jgi:hypothetical protein